MEAGVIKIQEEFHRIVDSIRSKLQQSQLDQLMEHRGRMDQLIKIHKDLVKMGRRPKTSVVEKTNRSTKSPALTTEIT